MKAYTYQIGKGAGETMENVTFSQELFADSLGEAVDMAKAMTRKRTVQTAEDLVQLVDNDQPDAQMVWTRLADEIRNS